MEYDKLSEQEEQRAGKKGLFPEHGLPAKELSDTLQKIKAGDVPWKEGKVFGFVYHPGDEYTRIAEEYYRAFYYENTNNPTTFPSLRNFERDIIKMAGDLMHGGKHVTGNMTTGGTESIFLAVKVARDLAREKDSERFANGKNTPEVIIPITVHPAFLKACHYLNVKAISIPVREDKTADPQAIKNAIGPNAILIACSAPCFPYGVIDPVKEIGAIARKHDIPCHVDACMGGFMLPFLEDLGYKFPEFDFRVPGVTSISLDAHKYGYAPKGNSVILHINRKYRIKQFFIDTEWPGGIFACTTFMGTKTGGPIAGAWAIINHIGRDGYRKLASVTMKTALKIREGIKSVEGLKIIGDPDMTLIAFTSDKGDIYNIGDALSDRGWYLDRLQWPAGLHMTINKLNVGLEDEFIHDLKEIVKEQSSLKSSSRATRASVRIVGGLAGILPSSVFEGLSRMAGKIFSKEGKKTKEKDSGKSPGASQAALYGIHASISNRKNVKKLVENLIDGIYS